MADFPLTQTGAQIQGILDGASGEEIAIGDFAGETLQSTQSIAIGESAGRTNQSPVAVAIGADAGKESQGIRGVAIGKDAARENQGVHSVAIGFAAAIYNQPDYSIIINADLILATPAAIGDILFNTTTTSLMASATEIKHNDIIIAGSAMKVGTLASPPAGMAINEHWLDTTDSAAHPIERVSKVTT